MNRNIDCVYNNTRSTCGRKAGLYFANYYYIKEKHNARPGDDSTVPGK